jgi:signal peptidase I
MVNGSFEQKRSIILLFVALLLAGYVRACMYVASPSSLPNLHDRALLSVAKPSYGFNDETKI